MEVRQSALFLYTYQETDMIGVSRPVVKHSFVASNAVSIPGIIKEAFYPAASGRPGPVVIDVPKDTTDSGVTAPYEYPKSVSMRSYRPSVKGNHRQAVRTVGLMLICVTTGKYLSMF